LRLDSRSPVVVIFNRRHRRLFVRRRADRICFGRLRKKMPEGFDPASGAHGNAPDEWTVWILDEPSERFLDLIERVEMVHAFGALIDLTGGLLAPEKEDGENGLLAVLHAEDAGQGVFVLRSSPTKDLHDQVLLREAAESVFHHFGTEEGYRFAARGLVAGEDQRVESERVGARCRDLFLKQAAKDAGFFEGQLNVREVIHGRCWKSRRIKSAVPPIMVANEIASMQVAQQSYHFLESWNANGTVLYIGDGLLLLRPSFSPSDPLNDVPKPKSNFPAIQLEIITIVASSLGSLPVLITRWHHNIPWPTRLAWFCQRRSPHTRCLENNVENRLFPIFFFTHQSED